MLLRDTQADIGHLTHIDADQHSGGQPVAVHAAKHLAPR
jgi:hypothetical protein